MTIYQLLYLPIIATSVYMIGDLLVCAGRRRGSKWMHRIGSLLVAVAVATLALMWVGLFALHG